MTNYTDAIMIIVSGLFLLFGYIGGLLCGKKIGREHQRRVDASRAYLWWKKWLLEDEDTKDALQKFYKDMTK